MFSIKTVEIRWFFPGEAPSGPIQWHKGLTGSCEDQPSREDTYLLLPGYNDLGIKMREGRLEIKKRVSGHEQFKSVEAAGKLESWVKWSFLADDDVPQTGPMLSHASHWINIEKRRSLQKYEVSADGRLALPPAVGYPEKGLAVELSSLTAMGSHWWTLGMECFSKTGDMKDYLVSAVNTLLQGFEGADLSLDNSSGYPEWINNL